MAMAVGYILVRCERRVSAVTAVRCRTDMGIRLYKRATLLATDQSIIYIFYTILSIIYGLEIIEINFAWSVATLALTSGLH